MIVNESMFCIRLDRPKKKFLYRSFVSSANGSIPYQDCKNISKRCLIMKHFPMFLISMQFWANTKRIAAQKKKWVYRIFGLMLII